MNLLNNLGGNQLLHKLGVCHPLPSLSMKKGGNGMTRGETNFCTSWGCVTRYQAFQSRKGVTE